MPKVTLSLAKKGEQNEANMELVRQLQDVRRPSVMEYVRKCIKGMKEETIKGNGNNILHQLRNKSTHKCSLLFQQQLTHKLNVMCSLAGYIFVIIASVCANAQTVQLGVVKEYNEKAQKTPLSGVELNIRSANSTVSDKNGEFSLSFLTLKPGEKVNVRRIEKLGYEIFNKEAIEQWNLNPKNPFIVVMCKSDKFKKIRDNYEKVSSESYAKQLKKEEATLAKLKADGKLKEEEYQQQLFQLREEYENQLDNLNNYIDKFSRIDLSELNSVEQDIIELVQQGKIEAAIAKYEEQNYVDKYAQEVAQLKEVSTAIDRLEEIRYSKEIARDSLLSSIDRQIVTLLLAGGKDNFERIGVILRDVAFADTTSTNNAIKYAEFCLKQNKLIEAQEALKLCKNENIDNEQRFTVLMLNGNLNYLQEHKSIAIDYYKRASDLAKIVDNEKMQATAYHNIGTILLDQENYDGALKYLNLAKNIREKYLEESSDGRFSLSTTYGNIARAYENKKELNNAIEYYQKGIKLQKIVVENDFGKYGETLANTYNSVAALFHDIRDFDSAKENYLLSLSILEKIFSYNPFSSALTYANTLNNYAAFLIDIKSVEESLQYFDKAIDIYMFLSDIAPVITVHPQAMTKVNKANAFIILGRYEEAKTSLEESLYLFDKISSEDNPYVNEKITILSNYAIVLTNLNNIEDAEKNYIKAYNICQSSKDGSLTTEISKGRTYFNLGNFYSTVLNRQQEAQPYFKQSIEHFRKLMKTIPQISTFVSMSLNGLAYSYMFQGDYENAITKINEAISYSPKDPNFIDSKIEIQYRMLDKEGAKRTIDSFKESHPEFDIHTLPSYKLIYGE